MNKSFLDLFARIRDSNDKNELKNVLRDLDSLGFTKEPDVLFARGNVLRRLEQTDEAVNNMKHAVEIVKRRSQNRYLQITRPLDKATRRLQFTLVLVSAFSLIIILIVMVSITSLLNRPLDTPETSAFVSWLAQNQMLDILPRIDVFNQDGTSNPLDKANGQTLREIVSGNRNGMPDKNKKPGMNHSAQNSKMDSTHRNPDNLVPSPIAPFPCHPVDIPINPGKAREPLLAVMESAIKAMFNDCNCDGIAYIIDEHSIQGQGWRKLEGDWKGNAELIAAKCYYKIKNYGLAKVHAERVFCASDFWAVDAYLFLSRPMDGHIDTSKARFYWENGVNHCKYIERNFYLTALIAEFYTSFGSAAWDIFHDAQRALEQYDNALRVILTIENTIDKTGTHQSESEKVRFERQKIETYLARMELFLFLEKKKEFVNVYSILKKSSLSLLSDSYHLIYRGLNAMYLMRTGDYPSAQEELKHILIRYKGMDEFVTAWIWDGLEKFIQTDTKNNPANREINEKILLLRNVLEGDKTNDKVEILEEIIVWLSQTI